MSWFQSLGFAVNWLENRFFLAGRFKSSILGVVFGVVWALVWRWNDTVGIGVLLFLMMPFALWLQMSAMWVFLSREGRLALLDSDPNPLSALGLRYGSAYGLFCYLSIVSWVLSMGLTSSLTGGTN
ncbi:hypothetical protein [Roseibium sp.]|uniref:hypothetical protein n=1 Tax=Roseibium sp. TaxID=1936156 RepID=UPI003A96BA89